MIKRVDHSGFVVRDLQEAIRFYQDTIGLTLRREFDVPEFDLRVAFMGLGESGGGAEVELMKFEDPDIPLGFRHISLVVRDMEAYHARLRRMGAEVTMPPTTISAGDIACMARDPNGITIELLEKPDIVSKG